MFVTSSPAGAVAKYCNKHVCVRVCPRAYLPKRAIFTIYVHVVYSCGSVLFRRGDEILRGRGNFGSFLPD